MGRTSATRITFLGGVGEVGRNMTLFEHDRKILIIDTGLMFPSEDMLGVDLVLPDFECLRDRASDVVGLFLTHGHEDHIGGVAFLLRDINPPIYGAPLTLGILKSKLEEHKLLKGAKLNEIKALDTVKLGPFKLQCFSMAHSIPDALGAVITTPAGRIVCTGDYKIDADPVGGHPTDLEGLARAGGGADLMLGDSTNAEHLGHTPPEKSVGVVLDQLVGAAKGRVIVACFASNLHRVQQIVDAAKKCGRSVSFLGRSMLNNVKVARDLGHLDAPEKMIVPIDQSENLPDDKVVIISTGSQGEPLSALSLMAAREHKWITLGPGDTVILSASPIPGNESAVRRVIDQLFRIGVQVLAPPVHQVHVSGHASAEDLKTMIRAIHPKWLVPVHGEYRMLATHAMLGQEAGVPSDRTLIVENGEILELADGQVTRAGRLDAGYVFVDGLGIGDVQDVVLRDRRLLADDGIIVCVVTIDSQNGSLRAGPDIISRGFVFEDQAAEFLEDATAEIRESLADLAQDGITDWAAIRSRVRKSLGKFVWKRTGRRPIILPIVMEV
ncbi:MAG: ribonuclease J [Actinomycetota bacterium]